MYRVLVVDDIRYCADSLADLLTSAGHEVRVAYDGPAALEIVAASQPEIVFLDLTMPRMDGLQLGRMLRKQCPEITLVALTGRAGEGGRLVACGFDYYLLKPVDTERLGAALACAARRRAFC